MGGLTRLESSPATAGAGFNLLPWRMLLHDLIALSDTWRRDAPLEERDSNPRSAVRKTLLEAARSTTRQLRCRDFVERDRGFESGSLQR